MKNVIDALVRELGPELITTVVVGFVISGLVFIVNYLPFVGKYYKSAYRQESAVGLLMFLFDRGYTGEGLTFMELEKLPYYGKILTNLYIPTEEGTTEIDLIYLCPFGIYVLESKNYSGWIFGNEDAKTWTSVLYKRKNKFANPIWQNQRHKKYLARILKNVELKSIIVFSERCELKKLTLNNAVVIKRNDLRKTLMNDANRMIYSNDQIARFYSLLKRYTNKSNKDKQLHIDRIPKTLAK